jgi:hypothetical protein
MAASGQTTGARRLRLRRAGYMTPPHRLPLNSLIFRELSGVPSRARGADHENSDSRAPGANRWTLASARGPRGDAQCTARGTRSKFSRPTRGWALTRMREVCRIRADPRTSLEVGNRNEGRKPWSTKVKTRRLSCSHAWPCKVEAMTGTACRSRIAIRRIRRSTSADPKKAFGAKHSRPPEFYAARRELRRPAGKDRRVPRSRAAKPFHGARERGAAV